MILFSADDYGYSQEGSKKILSCNEKEQIIMNTSILSNFVTSDALKELHSSKITKGIHLNLIEGKSIGHHETITNDDGVFFNKSTLLKKILKKKINLQEIYNEAYLQIEYIRDFGIEISYADSHQNTHFFPPIMNLYEKVLKKHSIKKVRGQTPIYSWFDHSIHLKSIIHCSFASYWKMKYSKSFVTSDKIILKAPGMGLSVKTIEEAFSLWDYALKRCNENIIFEVPCHLDYSDIEFQIYSSSEFYNLLKKNKIQPLSYAELS